MSDAPRPISPTVISNEWGLNLQMLICERCDWSFLLPSGGQPPRCPHCFQANLTPLEGSLLPECKPELVVPYSASSEAIDAAIRQFAEDIPYAPTELEYATLRARLFSVYLPVWLVDANVEANWRTEAGFNYQVVSHQEQFAENHGGWKTREVQETRIRWEARVGRLRRAYQNVSAPAIEEASSIQRQLGDFDLSKNEAYQPAHIERACLRLPNRQPQDSWSDAASMFQSIAAADVQQACGADHLRQFQWNANFANRNWTLLLQPTFSTYYYDDDGQPQAVMIHGQSGRVSGRRRASMQRAQRASLIFLVAGLAIFVLGLLLSATSVALPPLVPFGILAMALGLPIALAAIVPVTIAWNFNRQQIAPSKNEPLPWLQNP